MPLIPAPQRQRREELCEFKANQVYIGSSRPAVSKNKEERDGREEGREEVRKTDTSKEQSRQKRPELNDHNLNLHVSDDICVNMYLYV